MFAVFHHLLSMSRFKTPLSIYFSEKIRKSSFLHKKKALNLVDKTRNRFSTVEAFCVLSVLKPRGMLVVFSTKIHGQPASTSYQKSKKSEISSYSATGIFDHMLVYHTATLSMLNCNCIYSGC